MHGPVLIWVALAVLAAVFGAHVARHDFLSDDCYISLVYARNLVEGKGLVWFGEKVEGYTNFLWVMLGAGAMALGLDAGAFLNGLGIASGFAVLALLLAAGARGSRWSDPWIWVAPACLAVHRTFAGWSTSGLETQFFTGLVLAGSLRLARERDGARRPLSALLFAAAALTRPEGNLWFAVAWCWLLGGILRGRMRVRRLAVWTALYVALVGGHFAWRYAYYGYPLPNTFYVKVGGFWWEQSRLWMGGFLRDYHLLWASPLLVAALLWRRDARNALLGVPTLLFAAYLLYVGGDVFEYRLATPLLPGLYWLLQEGVRAVHARLAARPALASVSAGTLAVLLVLGTGAPALRGFEEHHGIRSLENIRAYAEQRADEGRFLRALVDEGFLTGDEVIAVGGAGALPYHARLETVDFRGLNDATVAHMPAPAAEPNRGWIGHEKAASLEYLEDRRVALWDVGNRIVWPPGSPRPRPFRANRDFYRGGVCAVEAKGRYLVFATTLKRRAFAETFARFRILFYSPPRG